MYKTVNKERDNILPVFGPYSKRLAGISYIADYDAGTMVEFCGFLSEFRGKTELPSEKMQCSFFPYRADGSMKKYTYRMEVEWKDRVYGDFTYNIIDDKTASVTVDVVNNTEFNQSLSLHYLINKTTANNILRKIDGKYISPLDYTDIKCENPFDGLNADGKLTGEIFGEEFYGGHALGGVFGENEGDCVIYEIPCDGDLYIHAKGSGAFKLTGAAEGKISLVNEFKSYKFKAQKGKLTISCARCGKVAIDALVIGGEEPEFYEHKAYAPKILVQDNSVILQYEGVDKTYGVKWSEGEAFIREFKTDEIETFMPLCTHNHVNSVLGNSEDGHYTDIFIYPIYLKPKEKRTMSALIVVGEKEEVVKRLEKEQFISATEETKYQSLGKQLIEAALLTNVVFPIRCQGSYIRHFTPGKLWNSLYTWDTGFISLGLADINPKLAEDLFNTYLMEKGNIHAAFLHHGSMIPVAAYVYKKLYEMYGSKSFLEKYYSQMEHYYDFYAGRDVRSETRTEIGLIRPFKYFYNSGGWDDYPPQKYIHSKGLENEAIPVINTAMAINFARIMKYFATVLGIETKKYDEDIEIFKTALKKYSYDEESGYYSYIYPSHGKWEIVRYEDGSNYNMGLDGVYPFMAGICDKEETADFAQRIMSKEKMWTDIGISVVSQDAPYFSNRGYWNGSVWFPHQWFVFLGMLEAGYSDYAVQIGKTALEVFEREAEISYRCYEHFMIETGRGAGWHTFGGLSAPIVNWYNCFYGDEGITLPLNLWLVSKTEGEIILEAENEKESCFILTFAKIVKAMRVNGEAAEYKKTDNAYVVKVKGKRRYSIFVKF